MTTEPQNEYIITADQMHDIKDGCYHEIYQILDEIATRPYNPPAERERVLEELLQCLDCLPASEDWTGIVWVTLRDVKEMIDNKKEELRSRGGGDVRPGSKE